MGGIVTNEGRNVGVEGVREGGLIKHVIKAARHVVRSYDYKSYSATTERIEENRIK